jgi:hypothetical protein
MVVNFPLVGTLLIQGNITATGTLANQSTTVQAALASGNNGTGAIALFQATNDTGKNVQFGVTSTGWSAYGSLVSNVGFVYSPIDLVLMADGTGRIIFAAGGNAEICRITGSGFSTTITLGYGTGAGGTVTQATSKSTTVTLNKICGQITMNGAALAASTSVSFTVNNTTVAATDTIIINIASGATTTSSYFVGTGSVSANAFTVHLRNISAGSLSDAVVLNYSVIKAVNS